jgi:hypothetical protein
MQKEYAPYDVLSGTQSLALTKADVQSKLRKVVSRRSFLKSVCTVCAMLLLFLTRTGQAQMLSMRSSPPDLTPYVRPQTSEEAAVSRLGSEYLPGAERIGRLFIRDVVVSNSDPNLSNTDTFNDGETSIAINSQNRREIVITAFSGSWGATAPVWQSTDGGTTWIKQFTVPVPPGVPSAIGCPCDQTIDYWQFGAGNQNQVLKSKMRLSGTFLTNTNVYSGTTGHPGNAANWLWFVVGGVTQATNLAGTSPDQPWLLVNRDPSFKFRDNIYVAYDDFNGAPDMRVAVSQGFASIMPPNFQRDQVVGFSTGFINPGHRLAKDPSSGFIYSLFQRRIAAGNGGSQNIDYMLNRSKDGGITWSLDGSATGIVVANADSTQPTPKFGTVNALLGGVLHGAVDPVSGDLYYVYGNRDPNTGSNRLAIRRIIDGRVVGPEHFVTAQVGLVQAAIPSVAVSQNGAVGVFFYTFDGFSSSGFPIFSVHFSISNDLGITFSDRVLETFLSVATDNGNSRQRVLGDYMQMKAVENTFYGAFTGNGVPFGRPFANNDPIFFKISLPSGF